MAKRKIAYLINPISGTRSKIKILEQVKTRTKEAKIDFEFFHTNKEGNYNFLRPAIQDGSITDIVICGGDGSVSKVAGALLEEDVRFGIVPMGSGNGLAYTAKIPGAVNKALDIIFNSPDTRVDGFMINGQFSCMLCGLGFDAKVAHDFAASPTRGLQTYIKLSTLNFFKAKPYSFTIECNEKTFESAAYFISIANSNQFGNNFTIAPMASLKDGLMDIVIVKDMSKMMLPFSLLFQVTGSNKLQDIGEMINSKNIIYFQTDSLKIHNPQMAPLHIDGDPVETSDIFEINVLPKAFRLIQPFV